MGNENLEEGLELDHISEHPSEEAASVCRLVPYLKHLTRLDHAEGLSDGAKHIIYLGTKVLGLAPLGMRG